jgi:hypothetical protein
MTQIRTCSKHYYTGTEPCPDCMSNKVVDSRLEAYRSLMNCSHYILLNANDFFGYSCADAVELDTEDLTWALPIIEKYYIDGVYAVMSYIRKQKPLKEYRTKEFKQADKDIKKLKPKVWSETEK